jgi:hypothetical protein
MIHFLCLGSNNLLENLKSGSNNLLDYTNFSSNISASEIISSVTLGIFCSILWHSINSILLHC